MKKKMLAVVLGGLILFIWNAISWMALPFHSNTLNTIPDEVINGQVMQSVIPEDGIYHYPGFDTENMNEKIETGPRIPFMVYKAGKTSLFNPLSFLTSLLFNLISAALLLVVLIKLSDQSLKNVVITCLIVALMVGFVSDFPQMNWFMLPLSYTLVNLLDYLVGFGATGLFYAYFVFREA